MIPLEVQCFVPAAKESMPFGVRCIVVKSAHQSQSERKRENYRRKIRTTDLVNDRQAPYPQTYGGCQ